VTTRTEIAPQDAIWLDLERPTALMVTDALLWFDDAVDFDAVQQVVASKFANRFPGLRRRAVSEYGDHGPYYWEDDPGFDLANHVVRTELPADSGERGLQDYLSRTRSQPLPTDRPLWQVHFIERPPQGGAVLFRVHHSIADGIRVSQIVMSLCDDARGRPLIPAPSPEASNLVTGMRRSFTSSLQRGVGEIPAFAAGVAEQVSAGAESLAGRLTDAATRPGDTVEAALGHARTSALGAAAAVREAWTDAADLRLLSPSRVTDYFAAVRDNAETLRGLLFSTEDVVLTGPVGIDKQVAWSQPVAMREIRKVAVRTGTTVPDVVIASLAGAVRRYTTERGRSLGTARWLMPVPVRPFGEALPHELGSLFALIPFDMPVDLDEPIPRLAEIHGRLADHRSGPATMLAFGLAYLVPYVRGGAARRVMERGAERSVGLLSNLPGPRRAAYLAGTRVVGVMGFAPTAGDQPLSVSIVSYDGGLRVGFAVDASTVDDPRALAAYTTEEFARLAEDVSVLDGTGPTP